MYPLPFTLQCQSSNAISPRQLIKLKLKPDFVSSISVYKWIDLAIAVLQYYFTQWLQPFWQSKDVLFFDLDKKTQLQKLLNLLVSYLTIKVKGSDKHLLHTSTFRPYISWNQTLFSLNVILLEITYAASLESLQQFSDLTNSWEDQYTEFFTVRRLVKYKRSVIGIKCYNIMKQLIECVFPCGANLKNNQLQAFFHRDVICPLDNLEKGLQNLYLSDWILDMH